MTDTELKPCPFCGAELAGGARDNSDNAGAFFYYHPESDCVFQDACVWPHNIERWNTRAAPKVTPVDVLDAAHKYLAQTYGNSPLAHPADRQRILSAIE